MNNAQRRHTNSMHSRERDTWEEGGVWKQVSIVICDKKRKQQLSPKKACDQEWSVVSGVRGEGREVW